MKKSLVYSLICLFFFSSSIFAEEIVAQKFDFREAILIALENNNEIRAMKKALNATEKDIGIKRSTFLPKVSVGEDFASSNNPVEALGMKLNQARTVPADFIIDTLNFPGTVTNFLTYGMIEQVIFDKKAMVEVDIAKKKYSSNGYLYLRKQENLIKEVSEAYIQISTTQEAIKFLEQGLSDRNEQLKIANDRYKNKKGSYSDVLETTTQAAVAEQKLVSAKRSLLVAKRALGLLLGKQESVEISDVTPKLTLKKFDYYKEYSMYRNDVKAMEIDVETSKTDIKLAQADWYPKLTTRASYNFYNQKYPFGAQGQNYIFGAFFRWYAFDGNKRVWETRKARDKSAETEEYLQWLKKTVDFKVFEAYSKVEEAMQNYDLASKVLKSAEEGKKLVEKKWQESSSSPYVDVDQAQLNLDKARDNVVRGLNELKAQLINLYYESGAIKRELEL